MTLAQMRRWLLPASLSLNVFLGVLLAVHPRHGPPPPPDVIVERMAGKLSATDAAILRDEFGRRAEALAAGHRAHESLPLRVRALLLAADFDPAQARALFEESRQARRLSDQALEEAVVATLSRLSAEGRHMLAEFEPFDRPPPGR